MVPSETDLAASISKLTHWSVPDEGRNAEVDGREGKKFLAKINHEDAMAQRSGKKEKGKE